MLIDTFPKSPVPDALPILQHFHPNLPALDSPPVLLREHASATIAMVQMKEWERLKSLYGPLNALQQEECIIINKLAYSLGHIMEAIVRRDLMAKSVLALLAKDLLFALSALSANDYAVWDTAVDA